ncbi:DUF3080 family protein [Aliiglaciecola litoralis]|uniref:DUF3080 domain-containing protein n=1 Tax=Aliiglaciecola litoralis TaxID=582857 RepID=A0ABP3X0E6_9ALTE
MQAASSLLILISCAMLSACRAPAIVNDLDTYRHRLANVLNQTFVKIEPTVSLRFPPASQLRVSIPSTNISMRDFYALNECHVSTLIAQRNTALGKVQLPSVRLVYEYQLIFGLETCLASTSEQEQQQRRQLQQWIAQKKKHYPLVWADLIQNSSEFKNTLSSNQSLLSNVKPAELQEYKQALNYLISLSRGEAAVPERVEKSLDSLRSNPLLAKLWRSQRLVTEHLTDINEKLARAEKQLTCSSSQSKQQVSYLKNVFSSYFVDRIQPFASNMNQVHYTLSPIIIELMQRPELSAAFQLYLSNNLQQFQNYQQALQAHIEFWQSLFDSCGLSPQKSI